MALDVRALDPAIARALVKSLNDFRDAVTENLTTFPHADTTSKQTSIDFKAPSASALLVTAADASNLATLRTLCRDLWFVATAHFGDAVAHKAKDAANDFGDQPSATAALVDLQTWLNDAKDALEAHFTESGVHFTNDATYSITSADASDQGSSNTLANELKSDLNLHIQFALPGSSINLVPA